MSLEIVKMLVLSTAHLSEQTAANLSADAAVNRIIPAEMFPPKAYPVIAYEKGSYGWFVHVSEDPANSERPDVPLELRSAIHVARREGCQWIMFDRDGDTIDELPTYDW